MKFKVPRMLPQGLGFAVCLCFWSLQSFAQPDATIRVFDGSGSLNGLDLRPSGSGRFVYAIDFGGTGDRTVGWVHFTPDTTTDGLVMSASSEAVATWGEPNVFGDSSADQALAAVLQGMRWTPDAAPLTFSLTGLNPSAGHHLQLLFAEKCCDRGFDVLVNGGLLVPRFSARQIAGEDLGKGVVISVLLGPGLSEIEVVLRGAPLHFPDPSPVIQAATLEELPREGEGELMEVPLLTLIRRVSFLELTWEGAPGDVYGLQYSQDLRVGTWIDLEKNVLGQGRLLTFRDTSPARRAKPTGFYRVVRQIAEN